MSGPRNVAFVPETCELTDLEGETIFKLRTGAAPFSCLIFDNDGNVDFMVGAVKTEVSRKAGHYTVKFKGQGEYVISGNGFKATLDPDIPINREFLNQVKRGQDDKITTVGILSSVPRHPAVSGRNSVAGSSANGAQRDSWSEEDLDSFAWKPKTRGNAIDPFDRRMSARGRNANGKEAELLAFEDSFPHDMSHSRRVELFQKAKKACTSYEKEEFLNVLLNTIADDDGGSEVHGDDIELVQSDGESEWLNSSNVKTVTLHVCMEWQDESERVPVTVVDPSGSSMTPTLNRILTKFADILGGVGINSLELWVDMVGYERRIVVPKNLQPDMHVLLKVADNSYSALPAAGGAAVAVHSSSSRAPASASAGPASSSAQRTSGASGVARPRPWEDNEKDLPKPPPPKRGRGQPYGEESQYAQLSRPTHPDSRQPAKMEENAASRSRVGDSSGHPLYFTCPITQAVMTDPVCDREGNSYERNAIEAWVAADGTSPMTRNSLSLTDLIPNRNWREAIAGAASNNEPCERLETLLLRLLGKVDELGERLEAVEKHCNKDAKQSGL